MNIPDMYHDVLEFLRPGLFHDSVRRSAMDSLLTQIRNFIYVITTTCMNDVERKYDTQYRREQKVVLLISSKEARALVAILNLIREIATESDSTCRTVLKARILDMIQRVYVISPAFSQSAIDEANHWSALLNACASILLALSQSYPNRHEVLRHPVCKLWTDCNPLPPAYTLLPCTPDEPLADRGAAWRQTPQPCVKRRLSMILVGCLWKSNAHAIEDMEACADMVEFTRSEFYDSEIVELAFLTILKHVLESGHHARYLIKSIEKCPREGIVCIFAGTIRLWLECVAMQIRDDTLRHAAPLNNIRGTRTEVELPIHVDESFYDREKSRLFEKTANTDAALYNIVKFATKSAYCSTTIRCGMLDAGALSLVIVAFINTDFQLPAFIDVSRKRRRKTGQSERSENPGSRTSPIPEDVIRAEAATLTALIHTPTFRQAWRDEEFNIRRYLCSLLVDGLLGRRGEINDRYAWTNALFRKILV